VKPFFAFLIALLASCAPITPTPTPTPWPPDGGYSCATFCKRAGELGCPYADGTRSGTSCERVCLDVTQTLRWDLACRTNATTCFEIDGCERK
jgi:hypothetical protein